MQSNFLLYLVSSLGGLLFQCIFSVILCFYGLEYYLQNFSSVMSVENIYMKMAKDFKPSVRLQNIKLQNQVLIYKMDIRLIDGKLTIKDLTIKEKKFNVKIRKSLDHKYFITVLDQNLKILWAQVQLLNHKALLNIFSDKVQVKGYVNYDKTGDFQYKYKFEQNTIEGKIIFEYDKQQQLYVKLEEPNLQIQYINNDCHIKADKFNLQRFLQFSNIDYIKGIVSGNAIVTKSSFHDVCLKIVNLKGNLTIYNDNHINIHSLQTVFNFHQHNQVYNLQNLFDQMESLKTVCAINNILIKMSKGKSNQVNINDKIVWKYFWNDKGVFCTLIKWKNFNFPKLQLNYYWDQVYDLFIKGVLDDDLFNHNKIAFDGHVCLLLPFVNGVLNVQSTILKGDIIIQYDLNSKICKVDFEKTSFLLPAHLGYKEYDKTFFLLLDMQKKQAYFNSDVLLGNLFIKDDILNIVCSVHTNDNDVWLKIAYDTNKEILLVEGKGDKLNGKPWMNVQKSDNKSIVMKVNLYMNKVQTSANGYLKNAHIFVQNGDKNSLPNIDIVGFAAYTNKITSHESVGLPVTIKIGGNRPNRKVQIHTEDIAMLCKALNINIPVGSGILTINGVMEEKFIEGTAVVQELYTTQNLGLLHLIQLFSVGSWVNYILQPNVKYWGKAYANWKLHDTQYLEISDVMLKNAHYALFLNGYIDLISDYVELDGNIIPQTIWQRMVMSRLNPKSGLDFQIFGDTNDIKTKIGPSRQLLPFFLP